MERAPSDEPSELRELLRENMSGVSSAKAGPKPASWAITKVTFFRPSPDAGAAASRASEPARSSMRSNGSNGAGGGGGRGV